MEEAFAQAASSLQGLSAKTSSVPLVCQCLMNPTAQPSHDFGGFQEVPIGKLPADAAALAQTGRGERRASRIPVLPDRQPCELRVGDTIVPAALINESDTGLAVLTDRLDGLDVGREVELHTDAGTVPVQIVYINKVAACAYRVTHCNTLYQLGVKKTAGAALS
jgi:hypothetical protein